VVRNEYQGDQDIRNIHALMMGVESWEEIRSDTMYTVVRDCAVHAMNLLRVC
jgi:hypothetical protein